MSKKTITLERIKNIADDIISDVEWVNDTHTTSFLNSSSLIKPQSI